MVHTLKLRNYQPFRFCLPTRLLRYRAPEVGMCRGFYSHTIDMWSLGCVFAELLYCMQPDFHTSLRFLFPGSMCRSEFKPLNFKPPVHASEMLAKYHSILGPPTLDDVAEFAHMAGEAMYARTSQCASEAAREAARQQAVEEVTLLLTTGYSKSIPVEIPIKYSKAHNDCPSALVLLVQMLTYSPAKRISSSQALRHDFLNPGHADVTVDSLVGDDGHERAKRTAVKLKQLDIERLCHHYSRRDNAKIAELLSTEAELHKLGQEHDHHP
jgi:serine/threonine protein kinase